MLTELRKDLDVTFKRISTIRAKINSQYPDCQKGKNILLTRFPHRILLLLSINIIIAILELKQEKQEEQKPVDSSSSGSASTASPYNSDTN